MLNPPELMRRRREELRQDIAGQGNVVTLSARSDATQAEAARLLKAMRFNAALLEMMRIITIHCAAADRRLHQRDLVHLRRACVYI